MVRGSHCSYCGGKFESEAWPKACHACKNISYINPLPVVALIVPVILVGDRLDLGVLTVRRNIQPAKGKLGLPGGYMDVGETWQEAAARELKEEAGVVIGPESVRMRDVITAPSNGNLLVFCITNAISSKVLENFKSNDEVSEFVVVREHSELAFSTHTKIVNEYFDYLKSIE